MDTEENTLITSENLLKTIFVVAAPTMIQMLMQTSYHIIDAIWIGRLGSEALAAVAAASFILWLIFCGCSLVEIGVSSLAARYFGAREKEKFNDTGINGLRYSVFLAFLISLIFIFSSELILKKMGLAVEVVANAELFLLPILIGLPFYGLMVTSFAIFRGTGDTKTPLKILFVSLLLNTLLAPLLIFGFGFFPAWGIAGGAIASVVSQVFSFLFSFFLLIKKEVLPSPKLVSWSAENIRKINKIGLPVTINGIIFCLIYLFITKIVSQFGTAPVAAMGIGHRIESLAFCLSVGFSIATTTLVGQQLGANQPKLAEKTVWIISYYSGAVMLVISIFILLFSDQIVSVFSDDPEVKLAAMGYLFAIACTEVFLAFEIVMEGAFSGAGDTMPLTIVGIPTNILRVPLAWYLAGIYGINGVWWTIAISTVLKGVLLIVWFKMINLEDYATKKSVIV